MYGNVWIAEMSFEREEWERFLAGEERALDEELRAIRKRQLRVSLALFIAGVILVFTFFVLSR